MRDHCSKFKECGAEVLGCSTDSFYSHKAWFETDKSLAGMNYPVLADTNHSVSRAYNVLLEDKGITLRGTFIIDPNGVLRHASINDLPAGRSMEETLRNLQALQTGKATGCAWKPGQKPLN